MKSSQMKRLFYAVVVSVLLAGQVFAMSYINTSEANCLAYGRVRQDTLRLVSQPTAGGVSYRLYFDKPGSCELVFSLESTDGSDITPVCYGQDNGAGRFDCFAVYNGSADGNRFLLYDYNRQQAYITPACFADFYPILSSVDLRRKVLYLENTSTDGKMRTDTLDIGTKEVYVPYTRLHRVVKIQLALVEDGEFR